jgi:hypothetical protein
MRSSRFRSLLAFSFVAPSILAGCGVRPDGTLGADDGIPSVAGSTTITIPPNYMCGTPISDPEAGYEVTSSGTQDSCTFVFHKDVVVLAAADYAGQPEIQGAQFIRRVDFQVSQLAVTDGTGAALSTDALLDLDGRAFDVTIFTEADLSIAPPFTKSVEGPAVDALKSQIKAKADVIAPVDVTVVVALVSAPAQIGLVFEAQPELVLGF